MNNELMELMRAQPLFYGLDDSAIGELVDMGTLKSIAMGKSIFNEGDPGDAAYLIYSGKVRVFRNGQSGSVVTLATLGRNDIFGERAIITNEPRMATVRAAEDTVLFCLGRDDFKEFYGKHHDLKSYFNRLTEYRSLVNFLRLNTIFKAVPPKMVSSLLDNLKEFSFKEGEVIFREGDTGDSMYIVIKGEVKATREKDGKERIIAFLGDGQYFGERALMLNEPRFATVKAVDDTVCLALSKGDFDSIVGKAPKLRGELLSRIGEYATDPELEKRHAPKSEASAVARKSLEYSSAELGSAPPVEADSDDISNKFIKPKSRLFNRYPWYSQYDETDCGAASLAMISRYFGRRLSISRLRDLANVGREGASMFSLAAAAESIGFSTRAVRTDYTHLLNLDLPAIGHWAGYHYIVIYKAEKDYVLAGDPAIGLIKIPRKEFEQKWTGRLLMLTPTSRLLEQEEQKTSISRFIGMLKPYRSILFEVFFASLVINLFGLASPIFTQTIIDKVLVHQDANMLNLMLGGMIIVGIFATLTTLLRSYLLIHVSQKLSIQMASDLFRKIIQLPVMYFQKRKVGDILTRFGDNAKVRDLITGETINTVLDAIMVLVYLALMFHYNSELALVTLVFIPLSIILTLLITPLIKRNNQKLFEKIAASESKLIETIKSITSIKAATAEFTTRWMYEDLIVQNANQAWQGARLGMVMHGFSSVIQLMSSVVILWYGAHLVIDGELSVGQLVAFQVLVGMVMAPIIGLIDMWQSIQDTFLSLQRLGDIYDAEPEEGNDARSVIEMPPITGHIKIENLSFRYSVDDKNVLSNINLEIQPGEIVAIIGRSGSGKTTLISLLQRYYAPTEGRILINGTDVAGVSVNSLRSQMGIVLQESSMFSGTIRENIAIGDPEATIDRVIMVAKLANAHDFITSFPMGYETLIGESGIQVSGGQKQRIAIARALMLEPKIIIFDEATSALDTESERAIQSNMDAILENRSALIIAHRLSTIRNADRIIVMDDGMVAEQGNHSDLMERRGLYYYLVSQQMG